MKLKTLINRNAIRASATYGTAPENPEFKDSHGYMVKFTRPNPRRSLTVPFYMGAALTNEPTAVDVLDCLLSDASGLDNARDFDDWCGEYGYDTDSRKAERTYKAVERLTVKLRRFLGAEYDTFSSAERE